MVKKKLVDNLITAIPGEWEFNEQVAKSFNSHVRKSVPLYDEVQKLVVEMSEWFIRDNCTVYDIGCSTGETISMLYKKHSRKKGLKYFGIENSASMIDEARKKCPANNVEFIYKDVTDLEAFKEADFVTALYTLQFLPVRRRRLVVQRIYRDLSPVGAFVMVEKVRANNSFVDDIWSELYWDFKRDQGLSDAMILQKARSLRGVLVPLTLSQNIELLADAGFSSVDTFFKWHNFAGIIALKDDLPVDASGYQNRFRRILKTRQHKR